MLSSLTTWLPGHIWRPINSSVDVQTVRERFRRSLVIGNILFCCVDKIETRRLIWDAVKDRVDIFVEARMSAEVLRVLVAYDAASRQHCPTILFSADQAYAGTCTTRSTIYCANIAAAIMLSQFTKWLRRLPIDPDINLNLLANQMSVSCPTGSAPARVASSG